MAVHRGRLAPIEVVRYTEGMTVSETLRRAVETCGKTRYRIAQETGINESTLSRFVASGRALSMENSDLLCAYLGLELKAKRAKTRKGR